MGVYNKDKIAEFGLRDISLFFPGFFKKFTNPSKRITDVYNLSELEILEV